jgi:hypothetical protein
MLLTLKKIAKNARWNGNGSVKGNLFCSHSPRGANLRRASQRPKNKPTSDKTSRKNPRMNPRTAKPKNVIAIIKSTQFNTTPFRKFFHSGGFPFGYGLERTERHSKCRLGKKAFLDSPYFILRDPGHLGGQRGE